MNGCWVLSNTLSVSTGGFPLVLCQYGEILGWIFQF